MFSLFKKKPPLPAARPVEPTDDDDQDIQLADPSRAARFGLWALGIGFGGFLLWAAFAPLDEGVVAPGQVSIDMKRKAVQHLSGGIVKELLVNEGQVVTEGQVLIRLDAATAKANYEASRQRYLSLRANEARLHAEQAGAKEITWHPDLLQAASDPLIRAQMQNQEQLMRSRRGSLQAELQSIQESIEGQQGLMQAYRGMLEARRSQLAMLNDELKNTRGLVAEGYAPRNRQLELQRMAAESTTALAELQGNLVRATQQVSELRQRAIALRQEYRKEIEQQLADVTREVLSEVEKYHALQEDLQRTEIRSPATGQVVGLSVFTEGGVVRSGDKLMDIVPRDEPLLLEARVAPHFIDRVEPGLPVDIRFSAFAHSPQLVVEGRVTTISGDLITEPPPSNESYYLARVAVTPEGLKELGKRQMQPGMPAEVIFKTGERSLLTYLLGPLTKRIAASMKEE